MTAGAELGGLPSLPTRTPQDELLVRALGSLTAAGRRTPCAEDRDLWTSADAVDRQLAAARCDGCPVLDLCGDAAEARSEGWHVWGGVDRTGSTRRKRAYRRRVPSWDPTEHGVSA